jgi:hypothetical protein
MNTDDWRNKYPLSTLRITTEGYREVIEFIEELIKIEVITERLRICEILNQIDKEKWKDAKHCTCLGFAIDHIEHPENYVDEEIPDWHE